MDRRGLPFNECTADPSGSKRRKKAQEAQMREEEVAAKSRNIHMTILQWQWNPVEKFLRNL